MIPTPAGDRQRQRYRSTSPPSPQQDDHKQRAGGSSVPCWPGGRRAIRPPSTAKKLLVRRGPGQVLSVGRAIRALRGLPVAENRGPLHFHPTRRPQKARGRVSFVARCPFAREKRPDAHVDRQNRLVRRGPGHAPSVSCDARACWGPPAAVETHGACSFFCIRSGCKSQRELS